MSEDPSLLGGYRLERPVAAGGMGEIWRAVELATGTPVAIKRLKLGEGRLSEEHRDRLLREVQAFQRLSHPNIVRCRDSGLDPQGRPYLVLDWLEGESLAQRRAREPLALVALLEIARQALRGLGACHERGVIHRDIKPGNLFLCGEGEGLQVRLLDFGLAFLDDEASRLTQAGAILGTLYYLSPEQARGERRLDHRTDLYSLGVVLYELATGQLPFQSDAPAAVLLKIVTERPPRPRQLRPELPGWLEAVILRAMQREPADRYASAEEMLGALERGPAATTGAPLEASLEAPVSSVECRLVSVLCVQLAPGEPGDGPTVDGAVREQGGVVQALLGGQRIGLFGLDRSLGDEAARAVCAGLAVRGALRARARLFAATVRLEVGEGLRLDARELDRCASALSALPPGELVVDRAIQGQLSGRLELETRDGQAVTRALVESDGIRRVLGKATPLVGREPELAAARAALARAIADGAQETVLIVGPPGIGKSRLCLELLPELRSACSLFLEGRGGARRSGPLGMLGEALARSAGLHLGQDLATRRALLCDFVAAQVKGAAAEETAIFLAEAIGLPFAETVALRVARAEAKLMRERVASAFEVLLRSAAERGLVGLFLEDLHLADGESLASLELLLDRLERCPCFVLATARPELLERHPRFLAGLEGTRVELRPLGRRPLRRLLSGLLGREVGADLEELIGSWSEGNPYFVEELVCWLQARQALAPGEAGARLRGAPQREELPASIEAAIQGRLDGLPAAQKELLKAASVLGEVFWEGACEAEGLVSVGADLRELEAQGLVVARPESRFGGSREWGFRHALLHQVAAQMLPVERARSHHLRVAAWLEDQGETDASLLAHHFASGGDLLRAGGHNATAGLRALGEGDAERAVECLLTAISSGGEGVSASERERRALGLARAHITLSQHDQAWMVLDHLRLAEQDRDASAGQVLFLRGRILLGKGEYLRAEATLRQALEALEPTPDAELSFDVRHTLFWVLWAQGRYHDAGEMAAALYTEATRLDRADRLCQAKLAFAYYNVVEGDLSASVALAEAAVGHAREIGHPYREADSLTLLGSAQELVGLTDDALASLSAAQRLADRLKTAYQQASILVCRGRVCLGQARVADALAHLQAAIGKAEAAGDHRTLVAALATQARALGEAGPEQDLGRAEEVARRAFTLATDRAPPSEAEARLALAQVLLARGVHAAALEQALAAVEVLDRLGTQERYETEILLVAHQALLAAGRLEEARSMVERAAAGVERRAGRIADPSVREAYLGKVAHNRRARELMAD